MKVNLEKLTFLVNELADYGLLDAQETQYALAPAQSGFAFGNQMALADSLHLHIHVDNIANLPQALFTDNNAFIAKQEDGYVKYSFDGGINLIFSNTIVAKKEKTQLSKCAYLGHIGIDIRSDDKDSYIIFQQVPLISAQNDYPFTRQGGGKQAVACCYMQVKEKYWVYPNENINYEFAFGPLVANGAGFGVDLRPANPFKAPVADEASACCTPAKAKPAIFIN